VSATDEVHSPAAVEAAPAPSGRAGRNLPVATGVGLGLGGLVLGTLYTYKPIFLGVVMVVIVGGQCELVRALRAKSLAAPIVPLTVGAVSILVLAYTNGREAMTVAMLLTALAVVVWRAVEGAEGMLADIGGSLLALIYVGFLAGFAALMLAPTDGSRRVTTFIATVVASDVGGYAFGVLLGKHLMVPSVSPKKSWEGLVGSAVACMACGSILFVTLMHADWWQGVVFGLSIVCSATLGDLGESMIKRDLGIKDMGHLLPGHGGLMDRLDSLLPSAPVAWLVLAGFVTAHGA
jgi:phosphatidate cytidylyltransferase